MRSAICRRLALLLLRDRSAAYGMLTELTNLTLKENVFLVSVVLTDYQVLVVICDQVVLMMNFQVWLFYVFGPKTSMAAAVP
jgi:hypothetical protein